MSETEEEIEIEKTIILVKHAMPELDPSVPPSEWQLGDKGLKQTKKLAHFIQDNLDVDSVIYSSEESKAQDTAMLIASTLGLTHKTNSKIGEIDRPALPIVDEEEHEKMNEPIFKNLGEAILGEESGAAALARFEAGIKDILKDPYEEERLVVTHGTVMSLFLSKHNKEIDGFDIWKKLGCPSYAVVSVPDFKVLELNGKPLSN